ncbi:MAG: hypothetical protein OXF22_11730 [Anaerolineaceae bacterium]|nr:hypothetical protein [Anaerolineaceae bacterium]
MSRKYLFFVWMVLVMALAACGDSDGTSEPTEVAVTFSNAVPLPDYSGEAGFVLQIASGGVPTTLSSDEGAIVEVLLEEANEQTGTTITRYHFSHEDGTALTLYLPQELSAVPYPIRSWESLDSEATTIFATVQYQGQELAANMIGTLRVSEVGEGTLSATLYFDNGSDEETRITVAGDFRGLSYPGSE